MIVGVVGFASSHGGLNLSEKLLLSQPNPNLSRHLLRALVLG